MRTFLLLAAGLMISVEARADLLFDAPLANAVSFGDGGISSCSTGPATAVDGGFSISTNGAACFPYSQGWAFADNGQWNTLPALADDSGTTTITINLGGSYSSVWGFMDWGLSCGDAFGDPCTTFGNDPTITALDSNMHVVDTLDLSGYYFGSTNEFDFEAGESWGLTESTPDIAYFQIGGDYIALTDLAVSGAASPEPSTLVLAGFALGVMGWVMGRKRQKLTPDGARS